MFNLTILELGSSTKTLAHEAEPQPQLQNKKDIKRGARRQALVHPNRETL